MNFSPFSSTRSPRTCSLFIHRNRGAGHSHTAHTIRFGVGFSRAADAPLERSSPATGHPLESRTSACVGMLRAGPVAPATSYQSPSRQYLSPLSARAEAPAAGAFSPATIVVPGFAVMLGLAYYVTRRARQPSAEGAATEVL